MAVDRKVYSGFTDNTAQNLLLDSGAFLKNFDPSKDTFDDAVAAGKILGATRGGGKFIAKPKIRAIAVDGVKGKAKGLQIIDEWEVSIESNVLEVTKHSLSTALTASTVDTNSDTKYDIINAKNYIELNDYIDNITFVGKLSKGGLPIVIQIFNALNMEGLTLQTKDKDEAIIAMKFEGTYDQKNLDTPPFKIWYPKEKTV